MRRELSAGGLLVRRMRGRDWVAVICPQGKPRGTWVLPKGLIDEGERSVETAVRETREETGVESRLVRPLGDIRYVYTWEGERVFKLVRFFLVTPLRGRLGALPAGMDAEVAEARWLPLEEATRLLAYRGEREIAARGLEALALERAPGDPL